MFMIYMLQKIMIVLLHIFDTIKDKSGFIMN